MALFKLLFDKTAPSFIVRCNDCKHEFWTDAVLEENLVRKCEENGRIVLVEKCPNCGAQEE